MAFLKEAGRAAGTMAKIASPLMAFGLQNPAKAGRGYLEPIPGYGESAYRPYIRQGQEQDQSLSQGYGQMANDPMGLINAIMSQYQQSPGSQYQQKQMTQQAQNASRAGGYAGTMGDQRQQSELVQALSGMDMQQFLQNALGVKGAGMQGQQQLSDRGFQASGNLADYLGTAASQRAGLEVGGKQAQMGAISNLISNIMKAAGGMAGGMPGGGGGMQGMDFARSWSPDQNLAGYGGGRNNMASTFNFGS